MAQAQVVRDLVGGYLGRDFPTVGPDTSVAISKSSRNGAIRSMSRFYDFSSAQSFYRTNEGGSTCDRQ